MKPKVYIETTIVSYLVARPSRDLVTAAHQETTQEWWDARRADFELFYSQLVWDEGAAGDRIEIRKRQEVLVRLSQLPSQKEVDELAEAIMAAGFLPKKAAADAMHIAFAAVYGMDYLLTWNCRHINNIETIWQVEKVCSKKGYVCPKICSPEQLLGLVS
ncbi:MAG: type II toxin-antitoxin system VapC family toxin [Verrucomicrobiota bacterium]